MANRENEEFERLEWEIIAEKALVDGESRVGGVAIDATEKKQLLDAVEKTEALRYP